MADGLILYLSSDLKREFFCKVFMALVVHRY